MSVLRCRPCRSSHGSVAAVSLAVLITCFALILLETGSAAASVPPVAAYSFDEGEGETVEDLTGNEHTAMIEGAAWSRGRFGGAMEFDASEHDVLKVADAADLDFTEEFTLEAWVRPSDANHYWAPIVDKQASTSSTFAYWLYAGQWEEKPSGGTESSTEEGTVTAPEPLPKTAWSHVALTYDGNHIRIYVDGELVGTDTSPEPQITAGELQIGGSTDHGDWFDGRIDELRVYDRVLGAGEIAADKAAPIQTPQRAPIAAYSFDEGEGETVEDLTGSGHTAAIEGASWARGRYGGAMEFDASEHDVLKVADAPDLDFTEEFTIEAWVRPSDENNQWAPVAIKAGGGGEEETDYAYFLYEGGGQSSFPQGRIETASAEEYAVGSETQAENKVWTHLALTYDGGFLRLFIDGELVDKSNTKAPSATAGDLEIGGFTANNDFFDGRIDELRIYNRALDAGEIAGDRSAPLQTPQEDPIAAYSFDEGEGETAEDLTGNEHTAAIEGAAWTTAGRYGGAMEFDASEGDLLKVADAADLDLTEEFTIEAWVRPSEEYNQWAPVAIKAGGGGGEEETAYSYMLYEGGSQSSFPRGQIESAPSEEYAVGSETQAESKVWTHLALTYDGWFLRLYQDGELVDKSNTKEPPATAGDLEIGGFTANNDHFDGRIDELRIYNRALGEVEIGGDKAAPIQTPQRAPIAAYSFDEGEGETVEDLTGNEHTAAIEGAAWSRGRYGGAMEFDASEHDVLKVADAADLDFTEEFTLEAWVRPSEENNQWAPVAVKTGGVGEEESDYAYFLYEGAEQSSSPQGRIESAPAEQYAVGSGDELPNKVWSHLALTYDGWFLRLYVDGELVDKSNAKDPQVTAGDLEIGGFSSHNDFFDGRIDELRVYNRALEAGEIAADKAAPLQTPHRAPIAAYSFDEGEGEVANDITGNEHDAAIEGASWARGRYGGAMEFDASEHDLLSVADAADLDFTEEFTLEAWVRPSAANHYWAPIVDKQASSSSTFAYWLYAGQWEEKPSGGTESSSEEGTVTAPEPLPKKAWSHVALTYDGNHIRIYVDGELVGTDTSPEPQITAGELQIGGSTDHGDWFDGRIDELRVYDRALGAGEIGADQEPEKTPPNITLGGPLAEGMVSEEETYNLTVEANDGTVQEPGTGVRKIQIAVDGVPVFSAAQTCPLGNCKMTREWTFDPKKFSGETHEFLVTAEDQVGNTESTSFGVTAPDGDVTNCDSQELATNGPTEVEELPSGGTVRLYEGQNFTYELPVPPKEFNPITASDSELAEYGFPPRPEDPDSLDEWTETMEKYKQTIPANLCIAPASSSGSVASGGPDVSVNWSGYRAETPEHKEEFVGVTGTFTQPYFHPTRCTTTRSNHFVSIGHGPSLMQGGTVIGTDHHVRPFFNFIQPAYEEGDLRVPGLKIKANNNVRVTLFYQVANERLVISYFNNSTGDSVRTGVRNLPIQFYEGWNANWIDEKSAYAGTSSYFFLPNFDKNHWTNAKVYTDGGIWKKLGNANPRRVFMKENGTILAAPGFLEPDRKSFTNNFFKCSSDDR